MTDCFSNNKGTLSIKKLTNLTLFLTVGPVKQCVRGVLVCGRGVSNVYLSTYVNATLY